MREKIIDLILTFPGQYQRVLKAINKRQWVKPLSHPKNVVVIGDKDYPSCFYHLQYPPLVLFYEGCLELLNKPTLSVVGSRQLDDYSAQMTKECVRSIANHFVIVSGLAKGIDTIAHLNAKRTVGILGCGLDVSYPKSNDQLIKHMKKHHCVISEYPSNTPPLKHHFPWRNRLIVAASDNLWVMSATFKSGTMHSINEAINLNKTIYCLPHRYDSKLGDGCHLSINQGAMVLTKELVLDMINNKDKETYEKFSYCGESLQIKNN